MRRIQERIQKYLPEEKIFVNDNNEEFKKKYNSKIGVINFDPMPKMYFNNSFKNFKISSVNQKLELLKELKVDFIITKKFDKNFSKLKSI